MRDPKENNSKQKRKRKNQSQMFEDITPNI